MSCTFRRYYTPFGVLVTSSVYYFFWAGRAQAKAHEREQEEHDKACSLLSSFLSSSPDEACRGLSFLSIAGS